MIYVAIFDGDISQNPPIAGRSLYEVLHRIQDIYGYGKKVNEIEPNHYAHRWGFDPEDDSIFTPDPEDDKIEVWEVSAEKGTVKPVWGFWGWHWTIPENCEQGKMPNHEKSLYEEAVDQ